MAFLAAALGAAFAVALLSAPASIGNAVHRVPAYWPAGALALALAWRLGWGWAAAPAAGAALALGSLSGSAAVALLAFLGCFVGPVLGAGLLQRLLEWKPTEFRVEAALRFVTLCILFVAPLDAAIITFGLKATGALGPASFPEVWASLWIADAGGLCTLTPVVLALLQGQDQSSGSRPRWFSDRTSLLLIFALGAVVLMLGSTAHAAYGVGFMLLVLPLVVSIALRSDEHVAAAGLLVLTLTLVLAFRFSLGLDRYGPSLPLRPLVEAAFVVYCIATIGLVVHALAADRTHALSRVSRQARQDMSTGLLNDRGLLAELSDRLVQPKRPSYGLIGVQVANFDTLNDLCGPVTALHLEQTAAALLQRQPGMVLAARLSSGRYCLLVLSDSVAQVRSVAREVYCQLNGQVFKADHGSLRLIVSCGGLLVDSNASINAEDCMLSLSDAMAIANGVRDPQLFVEPLSQTTIDARRAHQEKLEHIREAIREQRFEVYAQPILDAESTPQRMSYEVLARLRDAAGGIMKPPEFLPLAAQAQLTVALDRGIIRSVFSWLSMNPEALARTHKCSINLSGLTMSDGTAASYIAEMRAMFQIPAEKIVFEITESEAIRNPGAASRLVDQLRADGFAIALDDFGTGLATFEYLKRFPIDYLKIDGSFIRNLITNPIDEEIVLSTIRVAHRLNVRTVAEHVHSQDIYDRLVALGVDHLQGDLMSRPRPLAELFEPPPGAASATSPAPRLHPTSFATDAH